MMKYTQNRYLYVHPDIDVDGSSYDVMFDDVHLCSHTALMPIFQWFNRICNSGLYIRYNRLYFRYLGVKYWIQPSLMSEEWTLINGLICRLRLVGCTDFYYDGGDLD